MALALEALEVTLQPANATQVVPVADPELAPEERLRRLVARSARPVDEPSGRDLAGWLRDIVEDPQQAWRSSAVSACALYAAKARGLLGTMDTRRARALGEPAIDEVLALAGHGRPSVP